MFSRVLSGFLLGVLTVGCTASADVNVKTGVRGDDDEDVMDYDRPLEVQREEEFTPAEADSREVAGIGARHDLSFRGPATSRCKCLSVAVGQGGDSKFEWETEAPRTDPQKQLVIAILEDECTEPGTVELGASYQGFRVEEENVIVLVEAAHAGRPKTIGAVIPKPVGAGGLFVEAQGSVPYGKALSGDGLCSVTMAEPANAGGDPQPIFKTK